MSYRAGYHFHVYERKKPTPDNAIIPVWLYDRPWDHSLSVEENLKQRQVITRLTDNTVVEVVEYRSGAVYVKSPFASGWLG